MLQLLDTTTVNGPKIGDDAPTGAAKINKMFKEVYSGGFQRPFPTTKVGVIADGDSKADEPRQALRYAAFKYNLDIDFSAQSIGVSGSFLSSMLASPRVDNLRTAIANALVNTPILDFLVSTTTNDGDATFETIYPLMKQLRDVVIGAGCRYLIFRATPPAKSDFGGGTMAKRAKIEAMKAFVRDYPQDCLLFDETNWMTDMLSATGEPIGGSNNAPGSVTRDGVHMHNYGVSKLSDVPPFVGLARAIYRQRQLPYLGQNDAYDDTAAKRGGNLIGSKGRFLALGGGTALTGATVVSSAPLGWNLAGHAEGLTVTFTAISEIPQLASQYSLPGIPGVRMTIKGTNTSDAGSQPSVQLNGGFTGPQSAAGLGSLGGNFLFGLSGSTGGCRGLNGVWVDGPYNTPRMGLTAFTTGDGVNDQMGFLNGMYTIPIPDSLVGAGPYNINPSILFYIGVGDVVDVTVDLAVLEWRKTNSNPRAS